MAIKSVSAWPETRQDITTMVNWTKAKLEGLGAKCELRDVGSQTLPDGRVIPLPNVIFGELGNVSTYLQYVLMRSCAPIRVKCSVVGPVISFVNIRGALFNHPISDYTQSGQCPPFMT